MLIAHSNEIGLLVRKLRKQFNLTQRKLALAAGVGYRFIVEVEKGKPTCEIEKVLQVLMSLGIKVDLILPPGAEGQDDK